MNIHFNGFARLGRECCYILHDSANFGGNEKIVKAAISNMKALSEFSQRFHGVFDKAIIDFSGLKSLFDATACLTVPYDFFSDGGQLRLPTWEKFFFDGAALCEAYKFLQKYGCSFKNISDCSTFMGKIGIFVPEHGVTTFNDIPIISGILNRPKDIFAFVGLSIGTIKVLCGGNFFTIRDSVKLIGNISKMVLIVFAKSWEASGNNRWVIAIDFLASNIAIIGLIWESHRRYQIRVPFVPVPAPAPAAPAPVLAAPVPIA